MFVRSEIRRNAPVMRDDTTPYPTTRSGTLEGRPHHSIGRRPEPQHDQQRIRLPRPLRETLGATTLQIVVEGDLQSVVIKLIVHPSTFLDGWNPDGITGRVANHRVGVLGCLAARFENGEMGRIERPDRIGNLRVVAFLTI